jgi:hypothetical protein
VKYLRELERFQADAHEALAHGDIDRMREQLDRMTTDSLRERALELAQDSLGKLAALHLMAAARGDYARARDAEECIESLWSAIEDLEAIEPEGNDE